MKRVVISGPTGAVGMALLQKCIREGTQVLALCRKDSQRRDRIPRHPLVRVMDCSLEEMGAMAEAPAFLEEALKDGRYEVFYHLAWGGTFGGGRDDVYLQNRNVTYTLDAVRLAQALGCTAFVGTGSQAEYGRVEGRLSEETPAFPENGYGMAKLCAGQLSRLLCSQLGMKHIWIRILSVYGPFDGEGTMVTGTLHRLLAGERTQFTKGEQQWDYLYSRDAAQAIWLAGEKGRDGRIYCLGGGKARPLAEYIRIMGELAAPGAPLGLGELPYAQKQVMYLCADLTALQEDTGFCPEVPFEEGIRKTLEWIKKEGKTAVR